MLVIAIFAKIATSLFLGTSLKFSHLRRLSQCRRGAAMSSSTQNSIRVTTYNVLSSHLGGADYYTSCKPEWLDPAYRFRQVKQKLDSEINKGAIICLQEISTTWGGSLHSYFAGKGYYFVLSNYGNKFNGYMGVGIAIPLSKYAVEDVNITRIADTKLVIREPKPPLIFQWLKSWIVDPTIALLRKLSILRPFEGTPWQMALNRQNQMVSMRLKRLGAEAPPASNDASTSETFVVGTYHMPCMFKLPQVMLIHTALSAQHIQRYARGDPCLFLGDFNFKPHDTTYKLITSGTVSKESPEMPEMVTGDKYSFDLQTPFRSAYREKCGTEPEFTNWAKVKEDPEFIDTLDYVFMSDHWKVDSVDPLPQRTEVVGPLPNEFEPSDHLPLSVNLRL